MPGAEDLVLGRNEQAPGGYDAILNGVPIELIRDGDGRWYQEPEMPWLPSQFTTGPQTFSSYDIRREGVHDETTFHLGFGQSRQRPQKGRYHYCQADLRTVGELKPPPAVTSVTGPNTGSGDVRKFLMLFNSALYSAVGPILEKSTDGGASWSTDQTPAGGVDITDLAVFQGINSVALLFIGLGNSNAYQVYDGTTLTAFTGDKPTVTGFLKTVDDGANFTDYTTVVSDGQPGTSATLNSLDTVANGDWLLIGYTTPFVGLKLDLGDLNDTASVLAVSYFDDPDDPGSLAAVSSLVDGTDVSGDTLKQDGTVTWARPNGWAKHTFKGIEAFWVRVSVSVAIDASVTVVQAQAVRQTQAERFEVVGEALYRTLNGNEFMITENGGTKASYGVILKAGDAEATINGVYSVGEQTETGNIERVWLFKPGQIFTTTALVPGTVVKATEFLPDANDGGNGFTWHVDEALYVSLAKGLFRFQNGIYQQMGPELISENDSPVRGEVTAVAGDNYYLYAAVQTQGGDTWLLSWGVYVLQGDGTTRFLPVWHTLKNLGAVEVRTMLATTEDTGGVVRLLIGADADLQYIIVSNESPNRRLDTGCTFDSTGQIFWSRFTGLFDAEHKAYLGFSAVIEGWDVGNGAAVALESAGAATLNYRLAATDSFASVGSWDNDSDDPRVDFASSLSGRFIDLRLDLSADSVSLIPVVRSSAVHYALRTKFKRLPRFLCRLSRRTAHGVARDGFAGVVSEVKFRDDLQTARKTKSAVTFLTPDGVSILVMVNRIDRSWRVEPGRPNLPARDPRAQDRERKPDRNFWEWAVELAEYRVSSEGGTIEAAGSQTIDDLSAHTITSAEAALG